MDSVEFNGRLGSNILYIGTRTLASRPPTAAPGSDKRASASPVEGQGQQERPSRLGTLLSNERKASRTAKVCRRYKPTQKVVYASVSEGEGLS